MGQRRLGSSLHTLAMLAAAAVALTALGACSKPLLGPTDERSPFDRYDAVRGNYSPQYIEDKFGHQQPNLRGRLTPKN